VDFVNEEWRDVPGYEGSYQVSDQGRVKSVERTIAHQSFPERIMSQRLNKNGYPRVNLYESGKPRTRQVHQLVMETFVGPRPDGLEVCHGNGNPADNRLENLRYDTRSANARDRLAHGTHNNANKTHCINGHPFGGDNVVTYRQSSGQPGIRRECRACKSAYARDRYAANSDKINAQRRGYRAANSDKISAKDRAYRAANRDELNAQRRARRAATKEAVAA
jgi:hypothetical protein